MAEVSIENLDQLLRSLAGERGLRGKLRVLGRAWTLLRSLSISEREQVAVRVGSQWAWQRLERTFLKDGELSESEALVGRAFERMGEANPRDLRELAKSLKAGEAEDAQDLLMTTLTEALEEEAEAEETARFESVALDREEKESTTTPTASAELVDTPSQVLTSTLAREIHPAALETAELETLAAPPAERLAIAPPEDPAIELTLILADKSARSGRKTLTVLRTLRENSDSIRQSGRSQRAMLIDSLGDGWAARRALSTMIETEVLADLDEALTLIERLERSGQKTWCLADLLRHWDLEPAEIERVLERAPSNGARRRLAARLNA